MKTSYYNTTNILNLPRIDTIKDNDYIVVQDSNNNTKTSLLQFSDFVIGINNVSFMPRIDENTRVNDLQNEQIADLYDKINEVPPEPGSDIDKQTIINLIYPVGSIYMSLNETSPSLLFGGDWSKIENMFLLGASSKYPFNSMGGDPAVTLEKDHMPVHNHTIYGQNTALGDPGWGFDYTRGTNNQKGYHGSFDSDNTDAFTSSAGGNKPHNNMPPYLAVNIWERTG